MILTVCMNPAVDRISDVESLQPENVKELKNTAYSAGGKGVNAARVLKALGADSLTIGFSGGHTGRFFESLLERDGLEGRFFRINGVTRINVTLLDAANGGEMHIVDPGPDIEPKDARSFRDLFMDAIGGGDFACAVFCGSLPPGSPAGFYRDLIGAAKNRGIKTALDSSGEPLKSGIMAKPDIVKPNSRELDGLAGARLRTVTEKIKFSAGFKIPETIVSMGSRGAFAVSGEKILRAGAPAARPVSSVGCGDALLAGYVFSRVLEEKTAEESLVTASACAAACLETRAPGVFSAETAGRLKSKIKIKRTVL